MTDHPHASAMDFAELHRALGRIEGKIDGYSARLDAHNTRIATLEKKSSYRDGAIAILSALALWFLSQVGLPRIDI